MKTSFMIAGVLMLILAGCHGAQHTIGDVSVQFTSANTALVRWQYWYTVHGPKTTPPNTQIGVTQNDTQCTQLTTDITAHRPTNNGQHSLVLWNVDSQRPLSLCLRIRSDNIWQDWLNVSILEQYCTPPEILEQPEEPDELVGNNIDRRTIRCRASGVPKPTLKWMINNEEYEAPRRLKNLGLDLKSDGRLVISEYRRLALDLDIQCEAANPCGKVRSNTVELRKTVREPQGCKSYDLDNVRNVNYTTGVILSCDSYDTSYPPLEYRWRFCPGTSCRAREVTRGDVLSGCNVFSLTDRMLLGRNAKDLVFTNVVSEDIGCYVCENIDKVEDQTCYTTTNLNHTGHNFNFVPKLLAQIPAVTTNGNGEPNELLSSEGNKQTFECLFQGRPVPTITWYHDNVLISPDTRHTLSTNQTLLTITTLDTQDNGEYKCVGSNALGSDTGIFTLNVNDIPKIRPIESQTAMVGENVTITCETESCHNNVTYDWFKNGEIIPDNTDEKVLTIIEASHTDSGVYKCHIKLRGRPGEASETFSLTVLDRVEISSLVAEKDVGPAVRDDPSVHQYRVACDASADVNTRLSVTWEVCPEASVTKITADLVHVNVTKLPCLVKCKAEGDKSKDCRELSLDGTDNVGPGRRPGSPYSGIDNILRPYIMDLVRAMKSLNTFLRLPAHRP